MQSKSSTNRRSAVSAADMPDEQMQSAMPSDSAGPRSARASAGKAKSGMGAKSKKSASKSKAKSSSRARAAR